MRAALAFALRRGAARLAFVLGVGGLVWIVYRALHREGSILTANLGGMRTFSFPPMSSPWELAVAALLAVVALVAAAALYRSHSIRG
jgi:hypothetical protein